MLDLHERAEWIANAEQVPWHRFLLSRFVGPLPRPRAATMAVVVRMAAQQTETHVELGGILEYSTNQALPVVFEFTGSLELQSREVSLQASNEARYTGRFSENGRVLHLKDATGSKPVHLIQEETLAQLTSD